VDLQAALLRAIEQLGVEEPVLVPHLPQQRLDRIAAAGLEAALGI